MIKAMAVDIDGTLTDNHRALCPISVEVIRKLKMPVILTTGNTHCFTRSMAVMLGIPKIFIAENGGIVSYSDDEVDYLADIKLCERAFKELGKITPNLQRHDARYRFTDIALQRNFDVIEASRYLQDLGIPVELIDTKFAVHIKVKGIDKGTGLRRMAEHLGISLKDVAAIGDSLSDIPMFRISGFRASVGNSNPELKEMSDYVAKASYGPGFAEIIDYMHDEGLI